MTFAAVEVGLRVLGLLGTSALCWLAYLAFGPAPDYGPVFGTIFKWLWFVPLPYLASYLALTSRSLAGAVAAFALLAGANLFITGIGLGIGISTFGLLALPAVLVGYFVLGWTLTLAEEYSAEDESWDRRKIHGPALAVSSFAVFASVFQFGAPPTSGRAMYSAAGLLVVGFSVHAFAAWPLIAGVPRRTRPNARLAMLLALAFVVPAWMAEARGFGDRGAMWLWQVEREPSARKAIAARHYALWDKRDGVTLYAGARLDTRFEGGAGSAVVPEGWVVWSQGGRNAPPTNLLTFRRDPESRIGGFAQEVVAYGEGWHVRSARPALVSDADGEAAWLEFGCDPEPPNLHGLVACRRLRLAPWEKTLSAALTAKLPETALQARLVFTREMPSQQGGSFFVFEPSFYAECEIGRGCRATLRQGERTSVRVTFREADLPHWRSVRTEVDALLLAATGRGLNEGSPLLIRKD